MRPSNLLTPVFGFTVLARLTFEVSAADDISYIGAVVEYYPVIDRTNGTAGSIANPNNYVTIIRTASSYSADIVVFPESSLTTGLRLSATSRILYPEFSSFIPEAGTDIPCDNDSTIVIEALRLISCAAKTYSVYVVVNLHEKENCSTTGTTARPCPTDGYFFYNTNVAFNRTGGIVARYRKYNLFGEPGFNTTSTPDISIITTDFNVTFGNFICFDILFRTPTITLITDYNVTNILFPAKWFSELPYLTAVQTQSALAHANNVNFLASAYNTPATGSGGSGIFAGTSGNLVTNWSEDAKNTLLVARIPKLIDGVRSYIASTTYPVIYDFSDTEITTLVNITTVAQQALMLDNLTLFNTTPLAMTDGTTTTSVDVCDRQLCCSFYVNRAFSADSVNSSTNYYRYRIAVFNGVRSFSSVAIAGTQICSIISCRNDNVSSCGLRFAATDTVVQPTVVNNIVISGTFSSSSTTTQMPDSLTTNILPLNASDFTVTKTVLSGIYSTNVTYNLTSQTSNLLTFAIYGRNFSADGLEVTVATEIATNEVESSAIPSSRFSLGVTMFLAAIVTLLFTIR